MKKDINIRAVVLSTAMLVILFLPIVCLATEVDSDSDGLNDELELKLGTDPSNADTDDDGFKDGTEVYNGFNPLIGGKDKKVKRRAEVNLNTQQLSYFFNDVKIGGMPVSTGLRGWDTPNGEFNIMNKVPSKLYKGVNYYYPNTKWNLEFKRGFYLHGAYWHNQFGVKPMSHGCVNIAYKNVEKLYRFMSVGDVVKIVGKTPTKVPLKVSINN